MRKLKEARNLKEPRKASRNAVANRGRKINSLTWR